MTIRYRALLILLIAGSVTACASRAGFNMKGPVLRAASDAPDRFEWEGHPAGQPAAACNSPMVDPRDDTRIRLARSGDGQGDYEVPAGRYAVGAGELLRLECGSGRVLGIVTR